MVLLFLLNNITLSKTRMDQTAACQILFFFLPVCHKNETRLKAILIKVRNERNNQASKLERLLYKFTSLIPS